MIYCSCIRRYFNCHPYRMHCRSILPFKVILFWANNICAHCTVHPHIMYIHLANPEGGMGYVLWRYIVCTLMHVSASIIFGLGLAKMWLRMKREGVKFRIKGLMRYYILASVLHGLYNATVMILDKAGVLTFD